MSAPTHNEEEECIPVDYSDDVVTVGIENKEISATITYKTDNLPDFLIWKMFNEGEYVVALEPRTTRFGGENITKNNKYVVLKPFEEYKTYLKFEVNNLGENK